jgi:short-subunit dehydrogenase
MRRYAVAGGTAVVTGAAGGIGRALATALARRGSHLALLDRDAERLGRTAAALRAEHPALAVTAHLVDLADADATERAATAVLAAHPRPTLLVNNAGVELTGRFHEVTTAEFAWVLEVNLRATVQLTHALLPALLASPGSHVTNVSSVFGLLAPAGQCAYATSKFAVRGFTEALRAELVPRGVGVTCVHPGGVATRIARDSRLGSGVDPVLARADQEAFERLLTIAPARAAEAIVRGVERRRARVLVGASARGPDLLVRAAPGATAAALAAWERRVLRRARRRAPPNLGG